MTTIMNTDPATAAVQQTHREALTAIAVAARTAPGLSLFEQLTSRTVVLAADKQEPLLGVLINASLSDFAGLVEEDLIEVAYAYHRVHNASTDDKHQSCCLGECACTLPQWPSPACDACEARLVQQLDVAVDRLLDSIAAGTSASRLVKAVA